MPLLIKGGDITTISCDAIVSATGEDLISGGGVSAAISDAAGEGLEEALRKIGHCPAGSSVITPAFGLDAKFIIHTVGPVWDEYEDISEGEKILSSCYTSSLELAFENGCTSIAFPLIATGHYGCPDPESMAVAMNAVGTFLKEHDMDVTIVIFDRSLITPQSRKYRDLSRYVSRRAEDGLNVPYDYSVGGASSAPQDRMPQSRKSRFSLLGSRRSAKSEETAGESICDAEAPAAGMSAEAMPAEDGLPSFGAAAEKKSFSPSIFSAACAAAPTEGKGRFDELSKRIDMIDESFTQMLLRKIDEKGMKDSECYKKANLDRKHFSKIRSNLNYHPKKMTALALAVALELPEDEFREFLGKAGFTLSGSDKTDLIIEYFIGMGNYNVLDINEALFAFDQPLLGL